MIQGRIKKFKSNTNADGRSFSPYLLIKQNPGFLIRGFCFIFCYICILNYKSMHPIFLFLSGGELVLVFLVFLMFFGSSKIPELAKGLGKGLREFKKATGDIKREISQSTDGISKEISESVSGIQKNITDITSDITSDINKTTNDFNTTVKDITK
jgi:sec-independent protein translocase protein TatA